MKNFNILLGFIVGAFILVTFVTIFKAKSNEQFQDNIYMRINEVSYETIYSALRYRDTVSYEMEYDILTFIPIHEDEYEIISEVSKYTVAVFDTETSIDFLSWVHAYPLPVDRVEQSNKYYQDIIEEKIWK